MRMFIKSKNKYLSNDMKIFGTCSIPLNTLPNVSLVYFMSGVFRCITYVIYAPVIHV